MKVFTPKRGEPNVLPPLALVYEIARVMATSYTEIVEILEVKNVQYQVFQTLA